MFLQDEVKAKVTNEVSKLKLKTEDNENRIEALKNLQVDIAKLTSQPASKDLIKIKQGCQSKLQEVCMYNNFDFETKHFDEKVRLD